MAWTSEDQNPTFAPSSVNYAAALDTAAYYDPLSGGSASTGAPAAARSAGGPMSYSDRLKAATPEPWETRETSRELATSADRTAAARRYTSQVSTTRGYTMRRQGERSLELLHPQAVQRFALAAREAHAEGIPVGIYSAYRPPGMGVGGFRDKYKSTHAYGIGFDVQGIGRPGSPTARRWYEIATKYGLHNPYGPDHRKEWNHFQLVPEKSAYQIPGLRDTITASGPDDPEAMWMASGVDPEGVPYAGDPFGVSRAKVAAAAPPSPKPNPRGQPRMGAQGGREMATAYAPAPERMEEPFRAVVREQPVRSPQRTEPQGGQYVVREGDSLSKIAQRYYGDPNRWREIAAANKIRNPDVIRVGTRLVIPGAARPGMPQGRGEQAGRMPTTPPNPRMRPSREADVPLPRPRPERGANVPTPRMRPGREVAADGFDVRRLDDAAGPRPAPARSPLADEPTMPWLDRAFVDGRPRPGPVIPRTRLEAADIARARADQSLAAGGNLGTPETRMSIERSGRRIPAGPGMDTSGLIREPTAEESALQRGARLPLPTGAEPIDPAVAARIRQTPAVIMDTNPPTYTAGNGVRIWALR